MQRKFRLLRAPVASRRADLTAYDRSGSPFPINSGGLVEIWHFPSFKSRSEFGMI